MTETKTVTLQEVEVEILPIEVVYARMTTKSISDQIRDDPESYALHIKQWRNYRGITLAGAARQIGCSLATYRNWDDGRNWPCSIWLPVIADAFGCSMEEIFFPPPGMK